MALTRTGGLIGKLPNKPEHQINNPVLSGRFFYVQIFSPQFLTLGWGKLSIKRQEINMLNIMTTQEIVIVEKDKALTTSLHIADGSKANHKAVMQLIKTHIHYFNKFGRVPFEMRPFETEGGIQSRRIAILNEQHATFLMTLMRNTERVVDFKCALVQAFFETKEYLNSQHQTHANIHNKLHLQLDLEKADASLAGHILGSYRKKRDTLVGAIREVERLMQPCLFE